jgi:hypothetical protein
MMRCHCGSEAYYCGNCGTAAGGSDTCRSCGYVGHRVCGDHRPGSSSTAVVVRGVYPDQVSVGIPAPPMTGGLMRVSGSYEAGQFGVSSQVSIPGGDVEVYNMMAQMVGALNELASRMVGLRGHSDSTRDLMKKCRILSVEIQGEIELRVGPQGTVGPSRGG